MRPTVYRPSRAATTTLIRGLVALSLGTAACSKEPSPGTALAVGDSAPPFAARAITGERGEGDTLSLAGLRGKTVVLAFFPKARTPGCTTQMKAYRDRYATLFNGGREVVLLGVSTDKASALVEWAREERFPFAFVSDVDGELGSRYGALDKGDWFADRLLYVIGPDGAIVYKAAPFRQNSEEAYTELEQVIDRVVGGGAGS